MAAQITIRQAVEQDINGITRLFRETIQTVNAVDYNAKQVEIWSAGAEKTESWIKKIKEQYFLVACRNEMIVGFASLAGDGYLDFMYVHKEYQRKGIAQQLLDHLEAYARERSLQSIYSEVSITARPFFEKNGYRVDTRQEKLLEGIIFINYKMSKTLT